VSEKTRANPRERLLTAAIRMLAEGGPETLQARRLAAEVGMSTMAVYTHFGGMPQLIQELAREGFTRFGRRLEAAPRSADPVADLLSLGVAYRDHALENPELYRLMFGLTAPAGTRLAGRDLTVSAVSSDLPEGQAAFDQLVLAVTRIIEEGRARTEEDPVRAAAQMWSAVHGYVLLEIAGYFGEDDRGVEGILLPMATKLAIGAGDSREAAERAAGQVVAGRVAGRRAEARP
jgi:AcrR family transcriptional regulator